MPRVVAAGTVVVAEPEVRPEHWGFDDLFRGLERSKISRERLGDVLQRMAIAAPKATTQVAISRGTMLSIPGHAISQDVVSRAVRILSDPKFRFITKDAEKIKDNPGRPQQLLSLGSRNWAIVGVKIRRIGGSVSIRVLVTELNCNPIIPIFEASWPQDSMDLVTAIATAIKTLCAKPAVESRMILGVGIDVAGHVQDGSVVDASAGPFPGPLALSEQLSGQLTELASRADRLTVDRPFRMPVIVDNDVNILAVLETYRPRLSTRDLVVVAVFHDGVGSGLVLNGRVYRGGSGMAGEIGHLHVEPSTDELTSAAFAHECSCGQRSHVDCYATPRRIEQGAGESFALLARADRLEAGEPTRAARIFATAGEALGLGLANLVNIINPTQILLFLPPEFFVPAEERTEDVRTVASPPRAPAGSNAGGYLDALRSTVETHAYSTGKQTAIKLIELRPDEIDYVGARAAAVRVLDGFIQHAKRQCRCGVPAEGDESTTSTVRPEAALVSL
jgi:predicted NBD/HSP70 family sugar kinase